jgi:ribosomal protein L1
VAQDTFLVTVEVRTQAKDAKAAEAAVRAKLDLPKTDRPNAKVKVAGVLCAPLKRPALNEYTARWLQAEIDANDQDQDGRQTDLSYAHGSYAQQSPDIVAEQAGHDGHDTADAICEQIGDDLENLIARYGALTKLCDLLPD